MFPNYGCFNNSLCPDGQECWRPFCHFQHSRRAASKLKKYTGSYSKATEIGDHVTIPKKKSEVEYTSNEESKSSSHEAVIFDDKSALESNSPLQENSPVELENELIISESNETSLQSSSNSDTGMSLLQQLVSEAVKKVLIETPILASSINKESLIGKLDTDTIVATAVEQITTSKKSETLLIEGKKPRLYLPPVGTPNYNPTPISKLKHNEAFFDEETSNDYIPTAMREDAPKSVSPKFSSDDEDSATNLEFDMLDQLIAEESTDPKRTKAIKKRKKAFAKMNSPSLTAPTLKSNNEKDFDKEEGNSTDILEKKVVPKYSSKQSSDNNNAIKSQTTEDININCKNEVNASKEVTYQRKNMSTNEVSQDKAKEVQGTHSLLPKISQLARPTTKAWLPVSKPSPTAETFSNVEKMLEKLDCLSSQIDDSQVEEDLNALNINVPNKDIQKEENKNEYFSNNEEMDEELTSVTESSSDIDTRSRKGSEKRKRSHSNSSERRKHRKHSRKHHSKSTRKRKRRKSSHLNDYSDSISDSDSDCKRNKKKYKERRSRYKKKYKSHSHKKKRNKSYRDSSSYSSDSSDRKRRKSKKRKSEKDSSVIFPVDPTKVKQERIEIDLTLIKDESEEDVKPSEGALNAALVQYNSTVSAVSDVHATSDSKANPIPVKKTLTSDLNELSNSGSVKGLNMSDNKVPVVSNSHISIPTGNIVPNRSHSLANHVASANESNKVKSSQLSPISRRQSNSSSKVPEVIGSSPPVESKSSMENSNDKHSSKPKVLKEISLFDDKASSAKVSSRRKSSEKTSTTNREDPNKSSSKKSRSSSSFDCVSEEKKKQSHNDKKKEKSHSKHSSSEKHRHSSNKKSESKHKESSHSKTHSKYHGDKGKHSSNDKSHSKCDSEKSSQRSHRHSLSSVEKHKSSGKDNLDSGKESVPQNKPLQSVSEIKKNRSSTDSKESDVIGSPLPDFSALEEIPKEEWDELLCSTEIKAQTKESSDESYDVDPTSTLIDETVSSNEDDVNNPEVMQQCMKMFSEYEAEESKNVVSYKKDSNKRPIDEDANYFENTTKHKRIARESATGNLAAKPNVSLQPKKKTAGQIMLERYQKLKEEEVALQERLKQQRKEWEKYAKDVTPSKCISSSSVSSTSGEGSASSSVRLGPKTAASSKLLMNRMKGRYKIENRAINNKLPTPAMSTPKGSKRKAHLPKMETLTRPVITSDGCNKVPQTVRQRYLNCFIDEALKFCDSEQQAFDIAVAEEKVCLSRATTRMVYLNVAVNTIKKLRSQIISESAQELLSSEDKVPSPSLPSTSRTASKFSHPLNPNHKVTSHFSILAQGGQKGSWSIQKNKKVSVNIDEFLSGTKFFKCLTKYILTEEMLDENSYPRPDSTEKGKAVIKKINSRKKVSPSESERYCDRCHVLYVVDEWGIPVKQGPCIYHWGRPYKMRGVGGFETKYSCCQSENSSDGCCQASTHVSENFSPHSLRGFVRTLPKDPPADGNYGVYALDCEMCYTTEGNELTRITVIGADDETVYETLVKPDNPIIDYNTRFSGITAEDMENVNVTIRDVQAALLTRFSNKTILMGHSLESDFSAIKLIHDTVVDTSVVFPHRLGPPYKRALRNLASEYLKKIIQNDVSGHDSAEDAVTCMQLMKWKIKEDLKGYKVS